MLVDLLRYASSPMNASVLETFRLGKLGHGHATCSNALYHEVTIVVPEGREFVLSVEKLIAEG